MEAGIGRDVSRGGQHRPCTAVFFTLSPANRLRLTIEVLECGAASDDAEQARELKDLLDRLSPGNSVDGDAN